MTQDVTAVPARKSKRERSARGHSHAGIASFFAGIGGFDLGFQQAGFDPRFHCELNTFCQGVLRRH